MSASLSSSLDGVELKEGVPAINTGIPIIVACCITDQLCRSLLAQHTVASLAEKKLDFIGRRLRQVCLEYGAALFYTSSMPRKRANSNTASASSSVSIGTNIEALQDYIFHRLYEADFHFSLPARVVGSTDDFGILVPSGYDTADLIDSTTPEHLTKAASPSSSSSSPLSSSSQPPSTSSSSQKLTDETPWNAVFPLPHKTSKEPSRSHAHGHGHGQGQGHSVARVKAQDDVTFFKTLKFQLDNLNNHRSSAAGAGAGAGPGVGAGGKTGAAGAGAMSSKGGPGKAGGSRRAVDLSRRKSSFHAMQGMQKGGATKASTAAQLNNLLKSRRRTIAHPNNASNSASLLSSLSSISASASSSSSASASASPSSSSSSTSGSVNPRRATEGGKMQGHQPKDKRQVAVKQFFRSLLVSGPKNEANRELRSNAQKALKGMKPKPREGGSSGV